MGEICAIYVSLEEGERRRLGGGKREQNKKKERYKNRIEATTWTKQTAKQNA